MSIPDYQQFMLPLHQYLGDGHARTRQACNDWLAGHVHLTPTEREELLPGGRTTVLYSRGGWAATYLMKAGLVQRPQRGRVQITDRGRAAREAAKRGVPIDNAYLKQFPEFLAFLNGTGDPDGAGVAKRPSESDGEASGQTPHEAMESAHQTLRAVLPSDLLDRIKSAPPRFFEQLVLDLLVAMRYGGSREDAAHAVGGSGDGGVDGYFK